MNAVMGNLITATLVDWEHDETSKLRKQLKRMLRKNIKSSRVSNNKINIFTVTSADFSKLPIKDQRIKVEQYLTDIYSNYSKSLIKKSRKDLHYNGDSEIFLDSLNYLGLKEKINLVSELQHIWIDRVEKVIESIILNSNVSIWDLPGKELDYVKVGGQLISLSSDNEDNISNSIDELLITSLARHFLPFSKELLLELEKLLKIQISLIGDNGQISPELSQLLRHYIGMISGLQETLKLFTRQVSMFDTLVTQTVKELGELDSEELTTWLEFGQVESIQDIQQSMKGVNEYIKRIKLYLRTCLVSKDGHADISDLMEPIIRTRAIVSGLRVWVHKFEELPSFTTLSDGIAYEEIENEQYTPNTGLLLETQKMFKSYRRGDSTIYALRGVDIKIKEGEFVIIKGPSGAGKTTLLNHLAGLDSPGRGTSFFKGTDLNKLSDRKKTVLRRENFSFIFQNYALIPHLSAFENVKLPLDLNGLSKNLEYAIQELLDSIGIGKFSDHKPALLSGGQMQRLGVARALIHKPKVIFADEPTGDLDIKTGRKVMDIIKQYHKETGVTIVLVTHDNEIAKYGTRIINLEDGQIVVK